MPKFDNSMEGMLDAFTFETSDLLEKLDDILMRTEQEETIGEDDIGEIFRVMHTIKGSASMMGLQSMSDLAHGVEDLFSILRDKPDTPVDKPKLYDLLFRASDSLKSETENLPDESIPLTDFTDQLKEIHAMADSMKSGEAKAAGGNSQSGSEDVGSLLFDADEKPDEKTVGLQVIYAENCAMPAARAMVLMRLMKKVGEIVKTVPADLDADSADDEIKSHGLLLKIIADDKENAVNTAKKGINVEKVNVVEKPAEKPAPAPKAPKPAEKPKASAGGNSAQPKKESSIISVKLEKLDHLLDLVAEIVVSESAMSASPDLKNVKENLDRFHKSSRELKKLTDELQDVVMNIRMVPIGTAFHKMNRVVRDMNQKLKKNVTLVFEGEDTEVDKSIADILGDPLMHIVRNAVDHGIETPEERQKAGKTEPPTVTLRAGYDSDEAVISCTDNGAGMDRNKILAKAKKNGLLTKPENEYTDKEAFEFVVGAGFSTNEQVTEYSGRGVGMDVVKKNIEKVGGKLTVDSVFGQGSTFTIRIPLSLSIIDVLTLQVGQSSLSIPSQTVRKAFTCEENDYLKDPEGNELIYVDGKYQPLIRLGKFLDIPDAEEELAEAILLNCSEGGKEGVLMADRIVTDQQVVVKPFSPLLAPLKLKEAGLAGCSILGDGSITIILEPKEILAQEGVDGDAGKQN